MIIDLQYSDAQKIQLIIAINFISSKDGEEKRAMHSISGNTKFAPYSVANDVIDELFKSLCSRYQGTSMKGSNFIFDSVQLLCYK